MQPADASAFRGLLLVAALTRVIAAEPCSPNATIDELRRSVGLARDEAAFVAGGGCGGRPPLEEEACICSAFRQGWYEAARLDLRSRLLRKQPAPAMRLLAQEAHDAMQGILARLHPKYPRHLKWPPAIEWAQTDDSVAIKVRHARYTRGEPAFVKVEQSDLRISDDEVFYSAISDEKPGFVEMSLRLRRRLQRRDGCEDHEEGCEKWAAEGACDGSPPPGAPTFQQRCPRSCGSCPAASGPPALSMAWMAIEGGVYIEARKVRAEPWDRLTDQPTPTNRIALAAVPMGELLACVDGCSAEACPVAVPAHAAVEATSETQAAGGAACLEQCRQTCAASMSLPKYAVA